jgi:hypothetical protein
MLELTAEAYSLPDLGDKTDLLFRYSLPRTFADGCSSVYGNRESHRCVHHHAAFQQQLKQLTTIKLGLVCILQA